MIRSKHNHLQTPNTSSIPIINEALCISSSFILLEVLLNSVVVVVVVQNTFLVRYQPDLMV